MGSGRRIDSAEKPLARDNRNTAPRFVPLLLRGELPNQPPSGSFLKIFCHMNAHLFVPPLEDSHREPSSSTDQPAGTNSEIVIVQSSQ